MSQSVRWAFNWKNWFPSEKEFSRAITCVQPEEKERLGRFVFRKDVRASLAGRLLLRKFVSDNSLVPYNQIVFARDEHQKPFLKNNTVNLSFNVSHQGDYTILAGEVRDVKIGVDIMKLEYTGGKSLSEFFRLMNKNFSSSEWNEIRHPSLSEAEQIAMFYRHWALKESYVKALGVGIVIDLSSIDFRTSTKLSQSRIVTDTILRIDEAPQNWLFEETLLDSEHCIAVALHKNGEASESSGKMFEVLDIDTILSNAVPLATEDAVYTKHYFEKQEQPLNWK